MTLSVTTCLTLIALSNNVYSSTPRTAYLKAIDFWMLFSFVITFINLMAFCVIVYLDQMCPKKERGISKRNSKKICPKVIFHPSWFKSSYWFLICTNRWSQHQGGMDIRENILHGGTAGHRWSIASSWSSCPCLALHSALCFLWSVSPMKNRAQNTRTMTFRPSTLKW